MQVITSIKSLKQEIKKNKNKKIGFVPTMGALHDGHLSLIQKCRRENDISILSIFINPTQFGPDEDYTNYPREEKKDKILAQKEKIDIIFYPSKEMMYPSDYLTFVNVEKTTNALCGKSRPEHFRGVTTIVCKLLNLVEPDTIYLGQKDFQQAAVISKMIEDLNFNVSVKICPTVREKDGLALSSRNKYLSQKQRQEAPIIYQTLKEAKKKILSGDTRVDVLKNFIYSNITTKSSANVEYVECVDPKSMESIKNLKDGKATIAVALRFKKTRLIDNIIIN